MLISDKSKTRHPLRDTGPVLKFALYRLKFGSPLENEVKILSRTQGIFE